MITAVGSHDPVSVSIDRLSGRLLDRYGPLGRTDFLPVRRIRFWGMNADAVGGLHCESRENSTCAVFVLYTRWLRLGYSRWYWLTKYLQMHFLALSLDDCAARVLSSIAEQES